MSDTRKCGCCGKEVTRGVTIFVMGNSIGQAPHVTARAQRFYICETCAESYPVTAPFSVNLAVSAFRNLLESVGEQIREARSRRANAASRGVDLAT